MEQKQFQRQTAVILKLKDLNEGNYVAQEGWEPNYVKTTWGQEVNRVHVVATVVDKKSSMHVTVDDGSTAMDVRSFEPVEELNDVEVGHVVRVVGKPRVYQDQMYIVPEVLVSLDNMEYMKLHQTLVSCFDHHKPSIEEQMGHKQELEHSDIGVSSDDTSEVLDNIDGLDSGDGASLADIEQMLEKREDIDSPKKYIEQLLLHGEIFEIKPGMVKVLR